MAMRTMMRRTRAEEVEFIHDRDSLKKRSQKIVQKRTGRSGSGGVRIRMVWTTERSGSGAKRCT